ncbi:IS21 family transposase [Pectinatus cerevisiiphilus]|uniref:Transposase n=1 Tax=Pectinatus cerevisiiphilus TaxID=86956 RepID=A0A4V2URH3_9FIRM|nr:IS21 family transposase [Pectinatus cerevisiiphilus]TCS77682.1 transposase [Pectinatus cerevisiiphilus]
MLIMSQINHIRDLRQCGYRISEIAKKVGADHKTIRKYLDKDNFSPAPPAHSQKPSILDPYKPKIQQYLAQDKKHWYKQHHTARRIFQRLTEEEQYPGSYSVVQRYVKTLRKNAVEKSSLELVWEPGTAQVDFGEADFEENGRTVRLKYLTVSFPYSNDGYSQVFGGETAECVCQGLQDIFTYIGGVPPLLIFDNATGVGHRVRDVIYESKLFGQFRAHCQFRVRYCNPAAGYEKGNVERKVGYTRANLFVPVPKFNDRETYNRQLLAAHQIKAVEPHYKKGEQIQVLFSADKAALQPLPLKPFNVCRYEWLKADGYGKICLEGKHYYSTRPENAHKKVLVGIRANRIDILNDGGRVVVEHQRVYGDKRSDISDYSTTLATLLNNAGAWFNSGFRQEVPDLLRDYLDAQPKPVLRNCLRMMQELAGQYGVKAAISAMELTVRNGSVNICDASVLAARITGYGINTPPEQGPSLYVYDDLFLKGGSADDDTKNACGA